MAVTQPPRYVQIADELAMTWSVLRPNTLVESETQLADRFDINRQTAREVLRELERRTVVRRIVGRGTFTSLKLDYPIERGRPPSFRRVVAAAGYEHEAHSLAVRWRRASSSRPRELVSERVISVEGLVAAYATDTFVETVGEAASDRVRAGASIFDTISELGWTPWRRRVEVSMSHPEQRISEALGYATAPPPTWWVRSETVDAGSEQPLHRSETWMRADVFDVRIQLDLPVD